MRRFSRLAVAVVVLAALVLPDGAEARSQSEALTVAPPGPNLEGLTKRQRGQALNNQRTLLRRWQKNPRTFFDRRPVRLRAIKRGSRGSIRSANATQVGGCDAMRTSHSSGTSRRRPTPTR
jgi:hypothetical protein